MPQYAILIDSQNPLSGILRGVNVNSKIPDGALISPASYDLLLGINPLLITIDNGDIREMTTIEKINAPQASVEAYRQFRISESDIKTQQALSLGFEYPANSGKYFDMDTTARSRWIGLKQASDSGLLTFPQVIRYKDRTKYTILDAADLTNFYSTALSFEVTTTSAGGDVLDALESAVTLKDLEDVII